MRVIDLLNKIANGEELPKRIKYECDIYIIGEDACNKDVKYINEKKDVDGYTKYLFQDWILDAILNDEIEIIEEVEDIGYEVIEEITYKPRKVQNAINALIRNQNKIIERMKRDE